MIIGGWNGGMQPNAQLFNWVSLEGCKMPDLPYYVASPAFTFDFGVPVMCGGSDYGIERKTCYKMNTTSNQWIQVIILDF